MSRFCVIFVLVLAISQCVKPMVTPQVTLEVFYESKCPDSKDFISQQLQPAINQLQGFVNLKLIPFGKAHSLKNRYGQFSCQHGPTECKGNMVQDCALDLMRGRTDVEKVAYVDCEMNTRAGTVGNMQCVHQANIPVQEVQRCLTSGRGVELQLAAEKATHQIRPQFIPTITVGGTFNQEIQNSMLVDMMGTVCSLYKDNPPCAQRFNEMAMVTLYE